MARLPQGVRKRDDGMFEKRFTVDKKRYSVYASSVKELAQKEQQLRNEIDKNIYKNRLITLNTYFDGWITRKEQSVKTNSLRLYASHYNNHIRKTLGKRKIKDIERIEIINLQQELSKKLKPYSVNHVIDILCMILNDAVIDKIIVQNPAYKLKKVQYENEALDTIHRALSEEEEENFMTELKGNYYYHFIALMLNTGLRVGEVSALTWEDIDLNKNIIHINKTVTKNSKGTIVVGKTPKSKSGKRSIPLTPDTVNIIKEYKMLSKILPFNNCSVNVFVSTYGNIISPNEINKAINDTLDSLRLKGINIDPFTSHALRDTYATNFIKKGGKIEVLSKFLGHSSITMTEKYMHVDEKMMQEEIERLIANG